MPTDDRLKLRSLPKGLRRRARHTHCRSTPAASSATADSRRRVCTDGASFPQKLQNATRPRRRSASPALRPRTGRCRGSWRGASGVRPSRPESSSWPARMHPNCRRRTERPGSRRHRARRRGSVGRCRASLASACLTRRTVARCRRIASLRVFHCRVEILVYYVVGLVLRRFDHEYFGGRRIELLGATNGCTDSQ